MNATNAQNKQEIVAKTSNVVGLPFTPHARHVPRTKQLLRNLYMHRTVFHVVDTKRHRPSFGQRAVRTARMNPGPCSLAVHCAYCITTPVHTLSYTKAPHTHPFPRHTDYGKDFLPIERAPPLRGAVVVLLRHVFRLSVKWHSRAM